jgi:hypothetical protein
VQAEPLTELETALLEDYRESKEVIKKTASTLEMTAALTVVKVA